MMEYRPSLPRKLAGFALMTLSLLGAILPILPGFIFFALGLFVLRHQYMWAHRGMGWANGRWPETTAKLEAMEGRVLMRVNLTRDAMLRPFRRG